MPEIVGVRFRGQGKVYYFDPAGYKVSEGQSVIVETSRGLEAGEVCEANRSISDERCSQPLKSIMRIATATDKDQVKDNRKLEREALVICEEKILSNKLDMKLIRCEYTFDRSKLLFYFTADGRVDFRSLVRDLASIFRTRIELRQIGVRDEAKMLGGLGICGREFCCSGFLTGFQPVSIKMAKSQGLSLNPAKISGSCGRLMCCLNYEQEAYEQLIRETPKKGQIVDSILGVGEIVEVNLLTGILKIVIREKDGTSTVEEFHKDDVKVVSNKK